MIAQIENSDFAKALELAAEELRELFDDAMRSNSMVDAVIREQTPDEREESDDHREVA